MTGGKTGGSPAFVHPQAICESTSVGAGTRVWAFAHVLPGAVLGADCNVCDHVFIENDVRIGDRVTIKSGVQLWDGLRIADDVFIGPNATFSNDKFPRSKAYQSSVPVTTIGRGAMIGAGAVVTRDVPAKAIVSGNPARIVGYADTKSADVREPAPSTGVTPGSITATSVRGVTVHGLTLAEDLRGRLAAGEFGKDIPFTPKRYFMVFDVPG